MRNIIKVKDNRKLLYKLVRNIEMMLLKWVIKIYLKENAGGDLFCEQSWWNTHTHAISKKTFDTEHSSITTFNCIIKCFFTCSLTKKVSHYYWFLLLPPLDFTHKSFKSQNSIFCKSFEKFSFLLYSNFHFFLRFPCWKFVENYFNTTAIIVKLNPHKRLNYETFNRRKNHPSRIHCIQPGWTISPTSGKILSK